MSAATTRPIRTAEILSIGTELTVGETRDTNAGELARSLTEAGIRVGRVTALPDHLDTVVEAFALGLQRADIVVSTGGLGPTPDDLTREAIAAVLGEPVSVDADLERWLRGLWARRDMAFAEINLKQAWLIPSATPIANQNGTAPGWWVERPDGRIVVALPGPPREMRPMWFEWAVPRIRDRGPAADTASRTYRLTGIGESAVADLLGETLLRATNPIVATYARADAVDVRISATGTGRRTAEQLIREAEGPVLAALGAHVWATGSTTWPEAIGARLAELGWTLATWEAGTGGSLVSLFGGMDGLIRATLEGSRPPSDTPAETAALAIRAETGSDVALAVRTAAHGSDTTVSVAVATAAGVHRERRMVFIGGAIGQGRAALTGAAILLERLRAAGATGTAG